MSKIYLILLVLVVGAVSVNCAVISGKALFCRDPDTGKLHAVNTTWTASSFCGNYTCSMRKRNITDNSKVYLREFNVTAKILDQKMKAAEETETVSIEKKITPVIEPAVHKNRMPDNKNMVESVAKPIINSEYITPTKHNNDHEPEKNLRPPAHNCKMGKEEPDLSENNDRYLTENEINKIADMLHTIKKSDLDAIVDIYKLAQDIYHEIDEITDEEIQKEALNIVKETEKHSKLFGKPSSYWYDPLANKVKLGDKDDMAPQSSYNVYSTTKPAVLPSRYEVNQVISNNNVGSEKVPYYYPVTQFQRMSSYTNPVVKVTTQRYPITYGTEVNNNNYKTKLNNNNVYAQSNTMEKNPYLPNSRKLIQPSHLLPYPFANIHQYNMSDSRNFYYGSPWTYDFYNKYKYYQPYYSGYVAPYQKAVLINPHLTREVHDVDPKSIQQVTEKEIVNDKDILDTLLKGQMTPNWKTEPIPIEVLKDIRADIETSRLLKAFPLRKKVKLERVGKLINVDDLTNQVNRDKRFASKVADDTNSTDYDDFETVLERVTCHDQTQLGYFRIGNMSQPFPECCPQLIHSR